MATLLDEDAWHVGRDAEADVDGPAGPQLHRDAARHDLGDVELGDAEGRQRPEQLSRDRGVILGLGRLQLVLGLDDVVDQDARDADVVRAKRPGLGDPLHLGDHHAATVPRGQGQLHRPEVGPLVLERQVSALVGRGGADDGDVRGDRREEQPVLALEGDRLDDRVGRGAGVHRAALPGGIDEGVEPDLGHHARPVGGALAQEIEDDPARHVVGGDLVVPQHLPDLRRLHRGRAGRIGATDDAVDQARLGEVVDTLGAEHVAGGDRVDGGDVAGMTSCREAPTDRGEDRIGAA